MAKSNRGEGDRGPRLLPLVGKDRAGQERFAHNWPILLHAEGQLEAECRDVSEGTDFGELTLRIPFERGRFTHADVTRVTKTRHRPPDRAA